MRVLVVGSGAREHALAWHLTRSGHDIRVAPGNGGTPNPVPIQPLAFEALAAYVEQERIDLTIVGPEAPLAAGIVDHFDARGLKAFGPTREAARLEWSKAWAKDFLRRHGIPTAAAETVSATSEVRRAIERSGLPIVLKADGLAGGKGVFVVTSEHEAEVALGQLEALGDVATTVLVEEFLEGPELSLLAFTDGEHVAVMPPARDYKRLLDADRGPNTGGMGGYTWPVYATPELIQDLERAILRPTLDGMRSEGHPYRGVLYAGLMLTRSGPKVLEFNCRFGDPECQLILPLLEGNLAEICEGDLQGVRWREGRTYGIVLAAAGYPEAPRSGDRIDGFDELPQGAVVFHAGTRVGPNGEMLTAGGRVLTVVAEDRETALRAAEKVSFSGKQYRNDIGVEQPSVVGATAP